MMHMGWARRITQSTVCLPWLKRVMMTMDQYLSSAQVELDLSLLSSSVRKLCRIDRKAIDELFDLRAVQFADAIAVPKYVLPEGLGHRSKLVLVLNPYLSGKWTAFATALSVGIGRLRCVLWHVALHPCVGVHVLSTWPGCFKYTIEHTIAEVEKEHCCPTRHDGHHHWKILSRQTKKPTREALVNSLRSASKHDASCITFGNI
mmetsp:Transcript_31711/g.51160  ORF Transcript_31711/g.51160 Transcript_31711/m.51160 type:complete len:204 (+) Transcript_31711:334-945(+)